MYTPKEKDFGECESLGSIDFGLIISGSPNRKG